MARSTRHSHTIPHHDLALLAAPSVNGPLLELRDPESLRTGELVFAHGHPLGIRDALAMKKACCTPSLATNRNLRAGSSPTYGSHPAIQVVPSSMRGRLVGINNAVVQRTWRRGACHHWCGDSWTGRCHSARRNSFHGDDTHRRVAPSEKLGASLAAALRDPNPEFELVGVGATSAEEFHRLPTSS